MVEKDNVLITEDDYLSLYVIGYEKQGESIILSVGDKFIGVIDCFKVGNLFETKRILDEKGIPLDFICWTHVDWDHTYGLSQLSEFINENTVFITPEGYTSTEIRNMFLESDNYKHNEFRKIYEILDDIRPNNFISANSNTEIYNFKFCNQDNEFDLIMKAFAPLSKFAKDLGKKNLKDTVSKLDYNKSFGTEWYDGYSSFNNLFSVGLEITLKLKIEDIRICLTGDLDNEMIREMNPKAIERIFSRNTILKIPHHGSSNASGLIDFKYKNEMKFNYAVTTSFKIPDVPLPKQDILKKYSKHGNVFRTDCNENVKYGIVKYTYPIINPIKEMKETKEIELLGDAGAVIF